MYALGADGDIHARDQKGDTAFQVELRLAHVLEILRPHHHRLHNRFVQQAVESGHTHIAKYLILRGVKVGPDDFGSNAKEAKLSRQHIENWVSTQVLFINYRSSTQSS